MIFSVDGQQRNQGIEFTMFGEPIKGLKPIGGFTILDAKLTSTLNGTNNGRYAPGAPAFQANLGLDWDMPWVNGLTVGGRMIYTGNAYIDPANNFGTPAWTRFDMQAKYVFERADGKPIALRGQILNVGDNNFWIATNGYLDSRPAAHLHAVADRRLLTPTPNECAPTQAASEVAMAGRRHRRILFCSSWLLPEIPAPPTQDRTHDAYPAGPCCRSDICDCLAGHWDVLQAALSDARCSWCCLPSPSVLLVPLLVMAAQLPED